jgi:hypothetical protein
MSDTVWWEKDDGFDEDGYQQKYVMAGIATCPTCDKDVELVAETEEWSEDDKTGRWLHSSYGPGMGFCCGNLVVDTHEGTFCYQLDQGAGG